MVATRASTDSSVRTAPSPDTTWFPALRMPASGSFTPRVAAIHAPMGMSHIGEPAAPPNTEAMMRGVGVFRGR